MQKSLLRNIIFIFILTLCTLFTSCTNKSSVQDMELYDSYTNFHKHMNIIYDSHFILTKSKGEEILEYIDEFEKNFNYYNEVNDSIFHSRLMSNKERVNDTLESINTIRTYLDNYINNDDVQYTFNSHYIISILNHIDNQMYELEHSKIISAAGIINDYIKYFIIFIVFFLILCLVLLIILLYELKQKDFKIQETSKLLNYTIKGQEEEKRRIARELHDTVAQDMRYIIQLTKKMDKNNTLTDLVDKEDSILKEVRNICSSFIPQDIENKDLVASLNDIITRIQTQANIEIKLTILNNINFKNMDDERFLNFFRIIQEILNNAEKHSKASEISILIKKEIREDNSYIHLIVTDDGVGIDKAILDSIKEQKIITTKHHFGLKNIIQRVQLLNGCISFTSDKEFGTEISVMFPENKD